MGKWGIVFCAQTPVKTWKIHVFCFASVRFKMRRSRLNGPVDSFFFAVRVVLLCFTLQHHCTDMIVVKTEPGSRASKNYIHVATLEPKWCIINSWRKALVLLGRGVRRIPARARWPPFTILEFTPYLELGGAPPNMLKLGGNHLDHHHARAVTANTAVQSPMSGVYAPKQENRSSCREQSLVSTRWSYRVNDPVEITVTSLCSNSWSLVCG